MLAYTSGNIFDSGCQALVNPVNCVGVMGAGLAFQFKERFPENFSAYAEACRSGALAPGRMHVFDTGSQNPRFIINFPTKRHWRDPSRLEDIADGIEALNAAMSEHNIQSVAIPPLGSGLGGLSWTDVRDLIATRLSPRQDIEIAVYEPRQSLTQAAPLGRPLTEPRPAMNPELHAFFLNPSAADHNTHRGLAIDYRELCRFAGDQLDLLPYHEAFEDFLEDVRHARNNPDPDADHSYGEKLQQLATTLADMENRRIRVKDFVIEVSQNHDYLQALTAEAAEDGLSLSEDPRYSLWLHTRAQTLQTHEEFRASPELRPLLDFVLDDDDTITAKLDEITASAAASDPQTARASTPAPETASRETASVQTEPTTSTPSPTFDTDPLLWAGIGSRQTPPATLSDMTELAGRMANAGWHLTSGGAEGADTAFAAGTPVDQRTVWLPWPRYNGLSGPDCLAPTPDRLQECLAIAERLHPAWDRCSDGAKKLHARNVAILLGPDLDRPVDAVVCWTKDGAISGGTGMALRIAAEHNIPVLNLGSMTMEEAWNSLQQLRRSHSATAAAHPEEADISSSQDNGLKEGMARVLHLRNAPPDAIRIDRRTRWGNPFVMGRDGTREEVIARYRDHLWTQVSAGDIRLDELAALHGKDLACHCAPQPCHGDVLARAAAWAKANLNKTAAEETQRDATTRPTERPAAQTTARTYDAGEACVFRFTRDEWGVFSNFYPSMQAIDAAGRRFATSEHLYQAAKFRQSPEVQAKIAGADTAKHAAALGRDPGNAPDADWNDRRVDAMRWVIRMKREANPKLVDAALEKTGDRPIVEFSRGDSFWGAQPQGNNMVGQNILGRLWMELRQQVRDGDPRALSSAWDNPISPKPVDRAHPAENALAGQEESASDAPATARIVPRRVWAARQEDAGATPDTWQHIKTGYAALYRASGDRLHHLPQQEGFSEFRDLVAGAVRDGGCPSQYQDRLKALHETLQTQDRRHNTILHAQDRLDDAAARLADLKEKMTAEPGHAIETMPGYTAWLRDRDAAVETWRNLAEDPAHKEHMQVVAPDMMAPRIAELSNDHLPDIHRPNMDHPAPVSGQGVYTPSLQPLSQVYTHALAFVDRDPNLLAYAPQFDELKGAVSTALDECRHAPDLLDKLTTLRTTLDDSHQHMTHARAVTEDVSSASQTLCRMKSWSESTGRPIHEAPNFKSSREGADRALRHYEAAQKDPALALHLARADTLGVLAETALPLLQDARFREPVASEAALAARRRRSEEADQEYSMSA